VSVWWGAGFLTRSTWKWATKRATSDGVHFEFIVWWFEHFIHILYCTHVCVCAVYVCL